ncbi:MAG: tetratricopeptide repeat protein [bacterium]|nr:tetratricopeptide repeat protein [bacterium]
MHSGIINEKELSLELFKLFRDFIHEKSGLYLDKSKLDSLRMSLLSRVTKKNISSYAEYYDFLKFNVLREDEFRELLNLITINETSFFRNPDQFTALREVVLPEIINRKCAKDKTIRIWAAGCSSGEEPYSIAMTVWSSLLDRKSWKVHILGTDVSNRVLEAAKKGVYSKRTLRGVDDSFLRNFFEKRDDERDKDCYAVKDSIKEMVQFKYFNLVETPYPLNEMENWDIIFCRNVTIYFKPESTKRVIHNFYQSLAGKGYLFIGHSETLSNISDEFELVGARGAFFYCKTGREKIKSELNYVKNNVLRKIDNRIFQKDLFSWENLDGREKNVPSSPGVVPINRAKDDLSKKIEILLKNAERSINKENIEDAVKFCLEAENLDPLAWNAYFLLGLIYNNAGKLEDAIIQFKKVIYINPKYFLVHYYLGNIYQKTGDYQNAVMSFNNALEYLNKEGCDIDKDKFVKGINLEVFIKICKKNIMDMESEER